MTATDPALAGAAIADALRQLADLFDEGIFDGRRDDNRQAQRVLIGTRSVSDVYDLADLIGGSVDACEHEGAVQTSFDLPLGRGVDRDYPRPAYSAAVNLGIYHIARGADL